jgi:hypothetical protein
MEEDSFMMETSVLDSILPIFAGGLPQFSPKICAAICFLLPLLVST